MRYYVAGEGSCWTPTSPTRARARIFAQRLAKAGRSEFPSLFRAGLRCWALPNQTNHLAGLRVAGLWDPGSYHVRMEHSSKPSHHAVARGASTEATAPAAYRV